MAYVNLDSIPVHLDTSPMLLFLEVLKRGTQGIERPVDFSHLTFELFRIERNPSPAGANELRMTLYPSDALMQFCAATWAGDFNLSPVK